MNMNFNFTIEVNGVHTARGVRRCARYPAREILEFKPSVKYSPQFFLLEFEIRVIRFAVRKYSGHLLLSIVI